jgi:hypothetical protein
VDYTTINIHLGDGNRGMRRKHALERLASEAGYEWGGNPSVGRWLCALADEKLKEEAVYYVQLVEGTNAQTGHLAERIRVLDGPAKGVHELTHGWYVSDADEPVIEEQVREFLKKHSVDYPDDIPLIPGDYSISTPEWNAEYYGWNQPLEDSYPLWMQPRWWQFHNHIDDLDESMYLADWKRQNSRRSSASSG